MLPVQSLIAESESERSSSGLFLLVYDDFVSYHSFVKWPAAEQIHTTASSWVDQSREEECSLFLEKLSIPEFHFIERITKKTKTRA